MDLFVSNHSFSVEEIFEFAVAEINALVCTFSPVIRWVALIGEEAAHNVIVTVLWGLCENFIEEWSILCAKLIIIRRVSLLRVASTCTKHFSSLGCYRSQIFLRSRCDFSSIKAIWRSLIPLVLEIFI